MTLFASRGLFFGVMGSAAVLSLLRGFALAAILPVADFGIYAMLIAIGSFFSSLAGVGKVEEARKTFPRSAVDGRGSAIAGHVDEITRLMFLRVAGLVICAAGFASIWKPINWSLAILSVGAVIFGTAWCALLASALRAGNSPLHLAFNSGFRAATALILVLLGAQSFSLQGALLGEAAAAIGGGIVMRVTLGRMNWPTPAGKVAFATGVEVAPSSSVSRSGLYVFVAALASSAPFYLGRSLVGLSYSPQDLATFGFLMLFVNAAVAGLGITDQIFGSDFVKMQRYGETLSRQKNRLLLVISVISVGIFASLLFAYFIQPYTKASQLFVKFDISYAQILPILFYAACQVTTTVDWFLLAHDRENQLAISSIFYVAIFSLASSVGYFLGISFLAFIWILALTKAAHVVVSLAFVYQAIRPVELK